MRKTAFSILGVTLTLALSNWTGTAAWAQSGMQPGQRLEGFKPIDDYQLVLNGEPVDSADIYSNPTPAILVVAPNLEAPVLLWPSTRQVQTISFMKLSQNSRGAIDLLPNPVIGEHGSFSVEGLEVRFVIGENEATLRPRPPILGLHGAASLREKSAKYSTLADYYEPSSDLVERLRRQGRGVRVRVFFGTWCPACGQMVPRILKVAEQLAGSRVEIEFYGLPQGFAGESEAEAYDVHSVPTGVVFVDGREAGRIGGTEWRSPEAAIHQIVTDS